MASMMEDSRVLGFLFGTDEMRAVWSEKNWVQKWLDTEAALARAQGELGRDSQGNGGCNRQPRTR